MSTQDLDGKFKDAMKSAQAQWDQMKSKLESLEADQMAEIKRISNERDELKVKYDEAQAKIDKIEGQLANTLEQMESLGKTTEKGIDAMQLLDLYIVLMDNVFESSIHTRLLIILHGAKEEYTYNELATAAGISGIQVKQALFDLRNSDIVDFNEETNVIKLKMRFMD